VEPRPWHASYDDDVPPSIEYSDRPLPAFLKDAAGRFGDRAAIRFPHCTMTYAELWKDVRRFEAALSSLGVEPGTRVAIHLPNLPQTIIAFYATLARGAVAVMTNPLYVAPELEHQWHDAACDVCVTTDFLFAKRILPIRDRLPVRHYVVAQIAEYMTFPWNVIAPLKLRREGLSAAVVESGSVHRFRSLLSRQSELPEPFDARPDDLAALQYTGGTTGVSKGAMLTHGNLSRQVQQIRHWLPALTPGEDVFLSALPFFHVFGLTVAMNLPVHVASTMIVLPNPRDISRVIDAINRYGVTVCPIVPAIVNGINQSARAASMNVGTIKMCVSGSAPLPEDMLRRFEELTGGRILEGYGLTEASPVTHVNPARGPRKINSIGLPVSDTDCRLVSLDHPSQPAPPGEPGELLIRGPQVMAGYWNKPDETANALRDGWLHTGDVATMDDEGYFRIVGRKKEMIVCGGYNVYPDEIDAVLASHASVLESATIGIPDAKRGETVKSFVVLRPGAAATEAELDAFCRERLAAYKVPRRWEFRTELPKSPVLKILRRRLLEEEAAQTEGNRIA